MGQSTDAILMFGIDLGEGEDIEWPEGLTEEDESYPDLDGWIVARAGLKRPETENYEDPAWSAFWDASRKAVAAFPLDLVSHCSGEYPMWVLALRRTVQRANRGHPIEPAITEIGDAEMVAMQGLCGELGLPWSDPKWVLCSDWN